MTGKILRDSELCARDVDHVLDRHAERARMADRTLGMTARTARNVEGEHTMPGAIRGAQRRVSLPLAMTALLVPNAAATCGAPGALHKRRRQSRSPGASTPS